MRRLRREQISENDCKVVQSAIEDFAKALISKILHTPITELKHKYPENEGIVGDFVRMFSDKVEEKQESESEIT